MMSWISGLYTVDFRVTQAAVATLHTVFGSNLSCTLVAFVVRVVPQRDVGSGFRETLSHGKTDSGTSAGDDGGLALQGEQAQ